MARRTPPVHQQQFKISSEQHNIIYNPPKSKSTRKSPSLFSYLWNSLPTLPRAKDLDETISFAQAPGEIYDAMKYCCTAINSVFSKNLENNKDTVKSEEQSWRKRILSRSDISIRRSGGGMRKNRPGDWRSIGTNSHGNYR